MAGRASGARYYNASMALPAGQRQLIPVSSFIYNMIIECGEHLTSKQNWDSVPVEITEVTIREVQGDLLNDFKKMPSSADLVSK
jgi:hypothetical protein